VAAPRKLWAQCHLGQAHQLLGPISAAGSAQPAANWACRRAHGWRARSSASSGLAEHPGWRSSPSNRCRACCRITRPPAGCGLMLDQAHAAASAQFPFEQVELVAKFHERIAFGHRPQPIRTIGAQPLYTARPSQGSIPASGLVTTVPLLGGFESPRFAAPSSGTHCPRHLQKQGWLQYLPNQRSSREAPMFLPGCARRPRPQSGRAAQAPVRSQRVIQLREACCGWQPAFKQPARPDCRTSRSMSGRRRLALASACSGHV